MNLRNNAERRLLAVELMQHGGNQTRLAEALLLSRQTLHSCRESCQEFGMQGLLHGCSPGRSKSAERLPKYGDRVDLLYAILNCHGWIRSDDRWVVVRL